MTHESNIVWVEQAKNFLATLQETYKTIPKMIQAQVIPTFLAQKVLTLSVPLVGKKKIEPISYHFRTKRIRKQYCLHDKLYITIKGNPELQNLFALKKCLQMPQLQARNS